MLRGVKRNGFAGREKRFATDRQLAETETDRGLFRPRSTADCLRTFVLGHFPLLLIVVSFQSQLHRRGVGGGKPISGEIGYGKFSSPLA